MANFNIIAYRYYNPGLFHLNDKLLINHFNIYGIQEKRQSVFKDEDINNMQFITNLVTVLQHDIFFDYDYYIKKYPDLKAFNKVNALNHYLFFGQKELREPYDPSFNFENYYVIINSTMFHKDNKNIFMHYLLYRKPKLNILLYGSCQSYVVKSILEKYYSDIYTVDAIISYQYIADKIPIDVNKFSRADIFIYQPVHNYPVYNTDHIIKNYLSPNCKVISFALQIFYGYNPDHYHHPRNSKTLAETVPFGLVPYGFSKLSELIESYDMVSCLTEVGVAEIIKRTKSSNFLSVDFMESQTKKNLDELRTREASCTLKLTDFITANYKKYKLFHTNNHPTNILFDEIMKQLCSCLHVKYVNIKKDPEYIPLSFISMVYPCVEKYLGLKLSSEIFMNNVPYDYDTYIKKYIEILYPEKLKI